MPTLAEMADRYYAKRRERLAKQHEVDALKAEEDLLEQWLLANGGKRAIIGKQVRLEIHNVTDAVLSDFDSFSEFVAKQRRFGGFDLLYKRINNKTITEWWSQGKDIPGIEQRDQRKLFLRSL